MTDSQRDPMTGALALGDDVLVFTSGAFALNTGVALGAASAGGVRPGLLIDPAYFPGEIERLAAFLEARGASPERIVLTHSDWDHVAGAARWPRAGIVASSEYPHRTSAEGDRILRSLLEFDRKLYVVRDGEFVLPDAITLVGSPSDLVWDGPGIHLFPAGGHTPDGLMVLLRESRILFAGDHLSDREIPFVGDSVAAYLETLSHVRKMARSGEVEILVPGHGEVCTLHGILERIEEDADYLHRLDAWVRETLRAVGTTQGILDRCDEVVFRKGQDNPDVLAEHRSNVERLAVTLGARTSRER